MFTIKAKLVAKEHDLMGYTLYVFENLEDVIPFGHKYIMTTRVPNWNHKNIDIGEIGYLKYEEVNAGDKWYNSHNDTYVSYNYTNIYFIKFVQEVDSSIKDIVI